MTDAARLMKLSYVLDHEFTASEGAVVSMRPRARLVWRLVFGLHSGLFATAWWLLPGGFAVSQLKFCCNQVACPGLALVMAVGCCIDLHGRRAIVGALAQGLATLWLSAGLSALLLFSASMLDKALFAVAVGALMLVGARTVELPRLVPRAATLIGFATVGAVMLLAQRGPAPSTHALLTTIDRGPTEQTQQPSWTFASPALGTVAFNARSEAVRVERDRYSLRLAPLLTFTSRSPDRGWTLFASDLDRCGPTRRYLASEANALSYLAAFGPQERARVALTVAREALEIEGQVAVEEAVYSHLNSFTTVQFVGHRSLRLEFSACPGQLVEPLPHDYPVGRPLRLATLDEQGRFRIVEATSAEKGPFASLAEGTLAQGEPLTITLHDEGKPRLTITFDDWSSQLSAEPSPTAGWGMPQNAISFTRQNEAPTSIVTLELTLANTSVGRGFESVGHSAGVYRNRVHVAWLNGELGEPR